MRVLLCALLGLLGSAAAAADWLAFAESRSHRYEVLNRTARITMTPRGEEAAMTRGRIFNKAARTTDLVSWYVTRTDCVRGLGTLVVLDPAGTPRSRADFVFNSGTVASRIAASLCSVFAAHRQGGAPAPPAQRPPHHPGVTSRLY